MTQYISMQMTLKQGRRLIAALDNTYDREEMLDSNMPHGYQWERIAMMELRRHLFNAIAEGEEREARRA